MKDGSPGNGDLSSGLVGGVSGRYNVYITSPASVNVSGVPTTVTMTQEGEPVVVEIDQNNEMSGPNTQLVAGQAFVGGMNNAWFLLRVRRFKVGTTYTVTWEQEPILSSRNGCTEFYGSTRRFPPSEATSMATDYWTMKTSMRSRLQFANNWRIQSSISIATATSTTPTARSGSTRCARLIRRCGPGW